MKKSVALKKTLIKKIKGVLQRNTKEIQDSTWTESMCFESKMSNEQGVEIDETLYSRQL